MHYRLYIIFIFLFCCAPIPQALSEPSLSHSLSKNKIHLDESVTLEVQVEWPKEEAQYQFSIPPLDLENLFLRKQGESQETFRKNGQIWMRKTFSLLFEAQATGRGKIYSFRLIYFSSDKELPGVLKVPAQSLRIRGPVPAYLKYGFVLMGVALSVGLFAYFWFKRKKDEALRASEEPPALEEEVLQKLRHLIKNPDGDKSKKEIIFEMSQILAKFIADYYQLESKPSGGTEIIKALKAWGHPIGEIESLKTLMDKVHEAKFTGAHLSDEEFRRIQKEILQYVEGKKVMG